MRSHVISLSVGKVTNVNPVCLDKFNFYIYLSVYLSCKQPLKMLTQWFNNMNIHNITKILVTLIKFKYNAYSYKVELS